MYADIEVSAVVKACEIIGSLGKKIYEFFEGNHDPFQDLSEELTKMQISIIENITDQIWKSQRQAYIAEGLVSAQNALRLFKPWSKFTKSDRISTKELYYNNAVQSSSLAVSRFYLDSAGGRLDPATISIHEATLLYYAVQTEQLILAFGAATFGSSEEAVRQFVVHEFASFMDGAFPQLGNWQNIELPQYFTIHEIFHYTMERPAGEGGRLERVKVVTGYEVRKCGEVITKVGAGSWDEALEIRKHHLDACHPVSDMQGAIVFWEMTPEGIARLFAALEEYFAGRKVFSGTRQVFPEKDVSNIPAPAPLQRS